MILPSGAGKYYLYRHIRLDNNNVFYIGIGSKWSRDLANGNTLCYRRGFAKTGRPKLWSEIIKTTGFKIDIILETDNREYLYQKEIEFIKLYGKIVDGTGTLTNIFDGGDIRPLFLTRKHRKKISQSKKGIKQPRWLVELRRKSLIKRYAILQFDWSGKLIAEYECPLEAIKATGKSVTHIFNGVGDKVKYTPNNIWIYKSDFTERVLKEKIERYKRNLSGMNNTCAKAVVRKDDSGLVTGSWKSVSDIKRELGYDSPNIVDAIKKGRKANGSYWEFKNQ